MTDDKVGVLEQERRRQQRWRDRGLADPVAVVSLERLMRDVYGVDDWAHAGRAALDAYFQEHPHERPSNW